MPDVIYRKAAKYDVGTGATLMLEQAQEHVVGTEEDIGKAEGDAVGGDERMRSVDCIGGTDRTVDDDVGDVQADGAAVTEIRRDVPLSIAQDHEDPIDPCPAKLVEQMRASHLGPKIAMLIRTKPDGVQLLAAGKRRDALAAAGCWYHSNDVIRGFQVGGS